MPQCPEALQYLYGYFQELALGLAANGMTVPTASWESLAAWCSLRHIELEPWESLLLVQLSQLRAKIWMEKKPAPGQG